MGRVDAIVEPWLALFESLNVACEWPNVLCNYPPSAGPAISSLGIVRQAA